MFGGSSFGSSSIGSGLYYIDLVYELPSGTGALIGYGPIGSYGIITYLTADYTEYTGLFCGACSIGSYGAINLNNLNSTYILGKANIKRGDIRTKDIRGKTRVTQPNIVVRLSVTLKGTARIN